METREELAAALAEATLLGLVEWKDDKTFRLTEMGQKRGKEIRDSMPSMDMLIFTLWLSENMPESIRQLDRDVE